jgi:hypothetical protein
MLEDVKIKAVPHDHRDGAVRQASHDLSTISETESNPPNPPLYDTGKVERETIEDSLGNTTPAGLVSGQLLLLKDENPLSGLAKPVCGRGTRRTGPDDDDIVAHHLV